METIRLAALFRETLEGSPWHGPSLRSALEGVDEETARVHPLEAAHSISEIVLHLTGWTREVARRLEGQEPRPPAPADWPAPADGDWGRASEDLFAAGEELASAIERFPEPRLAERVGEERDLALGTGVSFRDLIAGALQHAAYHAGQIAVLKKS